jgi:phosphatidylinositol-specific phospholipase C-like protein
MRLRGLIVVVLSTVLVGASVPPTAAQPGPDVVTACRSSTGQESLCRGLEHLLITAGTVCRDATTNLDTCGVLDGTAISEDAVTAHEHSWLTHALALQRALDDDRPLQDELWTHTHNSFNADVYQPTFYGIDRNQIYSITDQLRMGVRAIELDLHWAQSVKGDPANGFKAVLVCHGNTELGAGVLHFGCGVNDRTLRDYLTEIRAWMDDNPDEVLMLYLENQLDADPVAHDLAAQDLNDVLGPLIYRTSGDCADLPFDTSRKDIHSSGARIILTGNCDAPGTAWGKVVHLRGKRWIESGLGFGTDFPAYPCTAERARDHYDTNWIRHYADETGLSSGAGGGGDVTLDDARNEVRCGVNMIGFDNLVPFDGRLEQVVWSWVEGQPSTGGCATSSTDGRFHATPCVGSRPFVCHDGNTWSVTDHLGTFTDGPDACAAEQRGTFAVPWNGFENERLKEAKGTAEDVWLNYRAEGSRWIPNAL